MSDEKGFPKFSSSQRTGAVGLTVVTKLVETELKWIFKPNHQENDFGIDGYVEIVREDGAVLGRSFALQIKTGKSHVAKTSEQGFLLYGELKHLNYFVNSPVPVALVWVDEAENRAWWVHVTPHAVRMTEKGWSILIPINNRFDSSSSKILAELAGSTDDYIPLLERLSMIRQAACQSGGVLFLVTKEEVNSGDVSRLRDFFRMFESAPDILPHIRGKFLLAVHGWDDDPREIYEIPKVRAWFAKAEKSVLGWSYYLDLDSPYSTFRAFYACTCRITRRETSDDGTRQMLYFSKKERKAFIIRHFRWLNHFTKKHQISLSVNKEISDAMAKIVVGFSAR